MAERGLWSGIWANLWAPRKDPLAATRDALLRAEAFVDPSRLFPTGLITAYNPSWLVSRKGMAIYDLMKRDEQVKRCLAFKKAAVLASGWEVASPGDQDADWEVTEFVRDTFTRFPGGWRGALKKMLTKLDYGFSTTEKVFSLETTWAPGKAVLVDMNAIKPHFIDFAESPQGELLAVLQMPGAAGGAAVWELPPAKFVVMTHDKEFENHYGRSDLEAAYRAWWLKDNAYKWYAVFLERYGMAPLFALYNSNVYQGAALTNLKNIVTKIQNATMGIIPRSSKDDLEFYDQPISAESKEIFLSALGRCDADIGAALLVPPLIGAGGDQTDTGTGQQGSFARSKTHLEAFQFMIEEEQGALEDDAVNSQVIPQLCDLNFAGLTSYPVMRCLPFSDEKRFALYEVWSKLVAGGIVNRIEDDEGHIRKDLGFPENEAPVIAPLPKIGVPGGDEGDELDDVPEDEQSEAMREFAQANGARWLRLGGEAVAVKHR